MKKKLFTMLCCTFLVLCLFAAGIKFTQSNEEEQVMDEYNVFGMLDKKDIKTITKIEIGCSQEEQSVLCEKDKNDIITVLRTIRAEKTEKPCEDIYGGRTLLILEYADGKTDTLEMTGSLTEPDLIYNDSVYKIQPDTMDACLAFRDSYLRDHME